LCDLSTSSRIVDFQVILRPLDKLEERGFGGRSEDVLSCSDVAIEGLIPRGWRRKDKIELLQHAHSYGMNPVRGDADYFVL
ncbi:MAG: hypothetical protein RSB23_07820, partial [Alistipes sp.]